MDNYLSYRWPDQTELEGPRKKHKKTKAKKTKSRRVWRDILIILLAVVVLGGLVAGSYFGIQYAAKRFVEDLPSDPPASTDPLIPIPDLPTDTGIDENWTADLLPWGECDPTVQLELLPRGDAQVIPPKELYKKLLPSIVCVEAYNDKGYSVGSGFIISESGYIVTNYHVIEGGTELSVMLLSDSSLYDAYVIGYDKELDLAVLKADGSGFTPAELGNSDELEIGDVVYAIGNPMGYLLGTMTDGIVSHLGERISALDYPGRLILTTAALNSGNSGGALVDSYGRVVGITSAKVTGIENDTVVESLGLAIPLSDARSYLNRILRTGNSARPSLGVQVLSPVEVDGVVGIQVSEATKGTPAYGVLLPGDLITHIDGTRTYSVDDVIRILSELDAGDFVVLTLIRDGEEMTVPIRLYDRLSELQ